MSHRIPPAKEGYYERLTPEMRRFVDEYLIDLNAAAASLRAGYTSRGHAWNLLRRPEIKQALKERRDLVANDRGVNGGHFVLGKLWDVATADPRELVEIRRVPCRYCWGTNGQYQFTKTEMDRLLKAYEFGSAKKPLTAMWPVGPAERAAYMAGANKMGFDPQGGDSYTTQRDANPECAECGGIGVTLHYVADTRKLSDKARQIYRGVRVGKDKIEVLMADQDMAITALAKHYGVATERKEVWLRTVDPGKLSDDDLLRAIAELQAIELERSDYQTVDIKPLPPPADEPRAPNKWRQAAMARARSHIKRHSTKTSLGQRRPRPTGAI